MQETHYGKAISFVCFPAWRSPSKSIYEFYQKSKYNKPVWGNYSQKLFRTIFYTKPKWI